MRQTGFSLIEVMVATIIIGILAATAQTLYQQYVIKTQVTRAVSEIASLKLPIEICLSHSQLKVDDDCILPTFSSSLLKNNYPQISNPLVLESKIIGTFGGDANAVLTNKKIIWQRDSEGKWTCTTDIPLKLRAGACVTDIVN